MLTEGAAAQPIVLIWVPSEVASDPEQQGLLAKETLRAAILDHPNIIRVFGLASLAEGLARVVEFADGETLRKVLDTAGKLPPELAAKVAADAAMGVHFAHLAGNDDGSPLLHGDLRPETLMVSFSGGVKVAGYGALSVAPREEGGKRVVHRRDYCAPEQIVGGRSAITVQTDVLLLGLILFECLTGQRPWAEEKEFDQAVVNTPLSVDRPEIPPELGKVILRATAKRANDRYASARDFREAIEEAIGSIATNEAFAPVLDQHFPPDQVRLERKRQLDEGIAAWARQQWMAQAEKARAEGAAVPAPPVAPTPSPTPVAPPRPVEAVAPPPPPPPRPPVFPTDEGPAVFAAATAPKKRSMVPFAIAGGLGVAALAVFALRSERPAPKEPSPTVAQVQPAASGPATSTPAVAQTQPPAPATTPPAVAQTPAAQTDAGAVAQATPPPPNPAAPAKPAEPQPAVAKAEETTPKVAPAAYKKPALPLLEVIVEPPVNVKLDGKPAGRTPFTVPTRTGRHTLKLFDKNRGIDVQRVVDVAPKGTTTEHVFVQRAYLTMNVPPGVAIYLDGKLIGNESFQDRSIYEGHHHLRVTLGQARPWEQEFDVEPEEHQNWNLKPTNE
jgi:serine/threonine-protein kinase